MENSIGKYFCFPLFNDKIFHILFFWDNIGRQVNATVGTYFSALF
jgi:hypothetical protein